METVLSVLNICLIHRDKLKREHQLWHSKDRGDGYC
jgi:hypothetical protein